MVRLSIFFILLSFALSFQAQAQLTGADTNAGDSCAGFPNGATRINADSNTDGKAITLICNGTTWEVEKPTIVGACSDGDLISYDAASGGFTCSATCTDNTPNGFTFTDNAAATASTLTTSNILRIQGLNCQVTVTVSGEGSPQFRICSDSGCSTVIQDWTNTPSWLNNDNYLQLRLTTSASGGDTRRANVFVGQGADTWDVTPIGDCLGSDPVPGTVCADGTVYAGKSTDGDVKMYTTRCDVGLTWTGTSCTGTVVITHWNNGNSTGQVNTGNNSQITGQANSAAINAVDSDSVTSGTQPHLAVQWCENLVENGHSDWYLPGYQELQILADNRSAIGNLNSGQFHWSSSESSASTVCVVRMNDKFISCGNASLGSKTNLRRVRCIRR